MLQGVHLTQQQRKRSHDGFASASTSTSTSTTGEWLEKRTTAKKGKPPLALGRLVSGKLVVPGSRGSGLATPRGASQAASASKSSSKKSSTLDAFFMQPKQKLAKSGSQSLSTIRRSSSSSSASTKLQPRPMLEPEPKGKGRESRALVPPSSDTEDDDDDEELAIESLLVPQPQPEHARNDVNLRSDPSPSTSTQFILPRMPTPAPGRSDPPELPFPEPEPNHAPTTFGFAPSAFVKAQSSPDNGNSAPASPPAKKRRVIETSSPVLDPATSPQQAQRRARVLASPSSAHSPVQTAFLSDEEPDDEPIVKAATAAAAGRQGSRIPWDTDDEASYARLNAVPSASQIAREVVAQRVQRKPLSPRKLPTVQAETTSYMDRFREESYSPVQYTWTESFADNVRGRLGMSPKKGRRQPQHLRWRKGGGTARQQPRADSWFDESATEHSSSSQSQSQQPALSKQRQNALSLSAAVAAPAIPKFVVHARYHSQSEPAALVPASKAIDDSGFLDACSSPLSDISAADHDEVLAPDSRPDDDDDVEQEEESIPSSQPDLPDEEEDDMSLFPETLMPTSHLTKGRESRVLTCLLDYARAPEPVSAEENAMDLDESVADSQPASFRAGESQEQVENELLGRAGGRVILAPDTQEVLDTETQDVSARETQWDTLRHAAAAEPDGEVPPLLALESEDQLDFLAETLPPQQGKARASVSASIAAGWFTDVLAEARAAEAAARAVPQQVEITDFFAPKHFPSRAAEGSERLARAVREQRTERKRVTFIPAPENAAVSTRATEAEEEEEEVIADSEDEEDHLLERLEYELPGLLEVDGPRPREVGKAGEEETQAVPSSQTQALPLLALPLPADRELEMHMTETQVVADSDVDGNEEEVAEGMGSFEQDDFEWPL